MTIKHTFFIIFSLFLFLFTKNQVLNACINLPEPNRFSITFFYPELSADTSFRVCYVDASYFKAREYNSAPEALYRNNLVEWRQFFNNEPTIADIAAVIYETELETLEQAYNAATTGKLPGKIGQENRFLTQLCKTQNTQNVEMLRYLVFAKQCEPHIQGNMGYWDSDEKDIPAMQLLAEQGKQAYQKCKIPYLKLRYAFQIMRLEHYAGNYENCITLYNKLVEPLLSDTSLQKSVVHGWILSLKSGALLHTKNIAEGMYGFASVFNQFPDSRDIAFQNFSVGNETVWNEILAMAKDDQEKAVLWMLKGMQTNAPDLESLRQMIALNPNWIGTEIMLARQINLFERYWLTPTQTVAIDLENNEGGDNENIEADKSFLQKISQFFKRLLNSIRELFRKETPELESSKDDYKKLLSDLQAIALDVTTRNKSSNPDLWFTAAAYTAYLDSNYRQCYQLLDKVSGANKKVQTQANLIFALAQLAETKKPDAELENTFAYALKDLPLPSYEYDNYSLAARALTKVAQTHLVNGNVPRAILFFDKARETTAANILLDFYASEEDLDELARWINSPKKTVMDTFLLNNSRFTQPFLFDVKATKMMRQLQFADALHWYAKIPANYWTAENENDYWGYEQFRFFPCRFILNNQAPPLEADTCNKYGFVQKLLELQEKANQNKQTAAQYYLQIANAFYNTPFWGYNGAVWQGNLVATLGYTYDYAPGHYPFNLPTIAPKLLEAQQNFLAQYGTRKVAETYYQKVIETATNPEMAAEATYWAALCKQLPLSTLHQGDFKDRTYLKQLKQQYAQTAFYQNKKLTCPGLADY